MVVDVQIYICTYVFPDAYMNTYTLVVEKTQARAHSILACLCASKCIYSLLPQVQTCNNACFYVDMRTSMHLFIQACIHIYNPTMEQVPCVRAFAHTPCIELCMGISMYSYMNASVCACVNVCIRMLMNGNAYTNVSTHA